MKAKHDIGDRVEEEEEDESMEREKRMKDLGCTTSFWKIPDI